MNRIIRKLAFVLAWMSISVPLSLSAQAVAERTQALLQENGSITSTVRSGIVSGSKLRSALTARRDLLKAVLRNDPASARSYALDDSTRSAILAVDPSVAALLEQNSVITGELVASVADDFQHGTSSTLYTMHTVDRDLHISSASAIPGIEHMVHNQVTVRGISLDEIVAADSLVMATPAEIEQCASVRSTAVRSLSSAANAAPATCSTTGIQRIAVLLVKFPNNTPAFPTGMDQAGYWNKILTGSNPSVNGFEDEVSYGQTSVTADVYGPFALSQAFDCNSTTDMQTAAIAAASGTVDFTQYNRYMIVFPVNSCWFGGLANIGCQSANSTINHEYSVVWLAVSSGAPYGFGWGIPAHELGHNLGMNHANTLDFGSVPLGPLDFTASNPGTIGEPASPTEVLYAADLSTPVTAVNTEYGDVFSVMGTAQDAGPYSAEHRANLLRWIPKIDEADITASGTYTLVPAEDSSGLRVLHVLRDSVSNSWLWLEFHQPTGFYTPNNMAGLPGNTLTSGALIHYEDGYLDSLHTYLLDMTPSATPNNFLIGTLAPGSSWSDPYSLLTLTAGAQTTSSLGISVSYDAPCATLSLSASELSAAGDTASLTITAPSTCSWTVSANASWITFPGTISGSGNATVPFTYGANTTASQRNSYITAQRQSLPVVQDGPIVTIVGISPVMSAGSSQSFTVTITDTAGVSDLQYVNLWLGDQGKPGSCEAQANLVNGGGLESAYLYLWDYTDTAVLGGFTAGSNQSVSNSGCTLYGLGSSLTVNGNQMALTLNLGSFSTINSYFPILISAYSTSGGWTPDLPVGTVIVNANPVAATPVISPSGGTFTSPQPVTITDATAGATIYYTSDGSGPTTTSKKYTNPITVAQTETINALASAPGYSQSLVAFAAYTVATATPVIFPNGGPFASVQTVTITDLSAGAAIYYTTDSSTPTGSSTVYSGPITVLQSEVINAIAIAPGIPQSSIASASFAINLTTPGMGWSVSSLNITTAQPVTVTISVNVGSGNPIPTGTVTLSGGGYTSTATTLNGGSVAFVIPAGALAIGADVLTANYTPDAIGSLTYESATVALSPLTVTQAKTIPAVTVTPSAKSITTAQPLTVLVAVVGGSGNPTPTGTVILTGGGFTSSVSTLSSGNSTINIPAGLLAAGTDTLSVSYTPDSSSSSTYNSASSSTNVTVSKVTPTVAVAPTPVTITTAQALSVAIAVSGGSGNPTPTGSVTLTSGSYTSAAATLSGGNATINIPAGSLSTGSGTLTVTYTPDSSSSSIYNGATGTNSVTVNPAPSFTLSPSAGTLAVVQGSNNTDTITISGANGFSGSVTLSASGLPSGVTASFGTNPATGSSVLTLTASSTATVGGPVTVSITGISGSITASTTIALTLNASPSFTLSSSAGTLSVVQGSSNTDTITVNPANGFTGSITLSASGLPSGVTASFGTNPATGSSVLTLTASSTATVGGPTTVTITGTSGSLTASTTVALTVNAAPTFVVGGGSSTLSIAPGATTGNTVSITVTPSNGFTGTVNLTCSITPVAASDTPTCTLTPTSVTITGTGAQSSTLTINTTAATSARNELKRLLWPSAGTALALLLIGLPRRKRNWITMLGALALVVTSGVIGCGGGGGNGSGGGGGGGGGGGNSGTTPGTYTITVTGTTGNITGTVGTVTLTVQ